jgi:hypothetical protein
MRKGLTPNIESIIDKVSELECIKPYILCGGTALAIQLGHRKSEDLDFMAWRVSKETKPDVDWPAISKEIETKIGHIDNMDLLGFDQVIFQVCGVKISFYVSDKYMPQMTPIPYQGNITVAPPEAILAMKLEVMLRRMKFRDYYDVYCIVKSGASIATGIDAAIKYSQFNLKRKTVVAMLLSGHFYPDANFRQLNPVYDVTEPQMREFLLRRMQEESL